MNGTPRLVWQLLLRPARVLLGLLVIVAATSSSASADEDTFTPYQVDEVPQTASELWADYDAQQESLDIEVVKEWKADGVVSRYVIFTVGTFKGMPGRIAAYYSFPDNGKHNPAFVWAHGGGQRAERNRGVYFASQGYATVDINWLGRPLEDDIKANTDWGRVDPTQGPRFYAKALRKGWKRDFQPDEYSIDPVPSPRNANWFLLAVAARRAISFLEQQPEVDAERIGFSGFSMGGMITALTAIDSRLKAVAPFVGGTGFKYVDFPGVERSSLRMHFRDVDFYAKTIDPSSYWPLVQCPTCFISSSNDFHSAFDRIYRSMDLLPHEQWRVTTNMHENHGPGPEQWVLLNLWFDQYLKGIEQDIPLTPPTTFETSGSTAMFTVTPTQQERLLDTEIYFSYDPNARTRFWEQAEAAQAGGSWKAQMPVHENLPLYVFALCRYSLGHEQTLERGATSTFTLNSKEHVFVPKKVNRTALLTMANGNQIIDDFQLGMKNWSSRNQLSIKTYKFQSPLIDRSSGKHLVVRVDPQGKSLAMRIQTDSGFLPGEDNIGKFSVVKPVRGEGPQDIIIRRDEFKGPEGKTFEWTKVATFVLTLVDTKAKEQINLMTEPGRAMLKNISLEK